MKQSSQTETDEDITKGDKDGVETLARKTRNMNQG